MITIQIYSYQQDKADSWFIYVGKVIMNRPQVHIIIVNWNRPNDTIDCIQSIFQSAYDNYKIILCENGSDSKSLDFIEKRLIESAKKYSIYNCSDKSSSVNVEPKSNPSERFNFSLLRESKDIESNNSISIISLDKNLGFTGGCNIGIDYALKNGADHVFLINNDATIKSNCLDTCVEIAKKTEAGIVAPVILYADGNRYDHWKYPFYFFSPFNIPLFRPNKDDISKAYWETDSANGCAMMIEKDVLKKRLDDYGFIFNEDFFMYCEETDFCLYARSINKKIFVSGESIVYHENGKSSGGKNSYLSSYYNTRNKIYLASFWLSPIYLLLFHLWYLPSRLAIQAIRLFTSRNKTGWAIIHGLVDGYLGAKGKRVNPIYPIQDVE